MNKTPKYTRKEWQGWELDLLHHFYPRHTSQLLAKVLNRSESSIWNAAQKWDFRKDAEFIAELTRRNWQKGRHENSKKHFFTKEHKPWNKGMKGLQIGGKETQFKPGTQPPNTKYDGAITLRGTSKKIGSEPYLYIRISKAKWKLLHRHVWEQHKGPIPKGHIITFKDGNFRNCNIENLECITMAENMKRNSFHYGETEEIQKLKKLTRDLSYYITKKSKKNGKK